jgi:hypothetical protein
MPRPDRPANLVGPGDAGEEECDDELVSAGLGHLTSDEVVDLVEHGVRQIERQLQLIRKLRCHPWWMAKGCSPTGLRAGFEPTATSVFGER